VKVPWTETSSCGLPGCSLFCASEFSHPDIGAAVGRTPAAAAANRRAKAELWSTGTSNVLVCPCYRPPLRPRSWRLGPSSFKVGLLSRRAARAYCTGPPPKCRFRYQIRPRALDTVFLAARVSSV